MHEKDVLSNRPQANGAPLPFESGETHLDAEVRTPPLGLSMLTDNNLSDIPIDSQWFSMR